MPDSMIFRRCSRDLQAGGRWAVSWRTICGGDHRRYYENAVEVPIGRRRGVFFDASGLASMITVTQNKLVYITYSILDARGMVVEQYDIPVGYVQGANSGILPAIEAAGGGRKGGDEIEITVG